MGFQDDLDGFRRHKAAQQQPAQKVEQWRRKMDGQAQQGHVRGLQGERDEFLSARNEAWRMANSSADPQTREDWNREAHANDLEARRCQREINEYFPRRQPQMAPAAAEWLERNKAFRDRYGQYADGAILVAHNYAVRPKIPGETNLDRTGMGLRPNTPEYFEAIETLLETSLPVATTNFALPKNQQRPAMVYNPNEKSPTVFDAFEAAATSKIGLTPEQRDAGVPGISAETYNEASRALFEAGKFSYQNKG